ncbi:MAG: hypothetical protein AABX19_04150 [Nanoarchaeota archaeon]
MPAKHSHKKEANTSVKKQHVVHTRLDRPIYLRKLVLRAAIDATKALKDYSELKLIRDEKTRVLGMLHRLYEDIEKRMRRLEEKELPKIPEMHKPKQLQHVQEIKVERQEKPKMRIEGNDDVSKLRREIDAIENRLKNL